MSIEGRINVDVLFHDKYGTSSIKVVTLRDSQEFPEGKVAVITGTAGTAAVTIGSAGQTTYRNAAGEQVLMNSVERIVFSWSGVFSRRLYDSNYGQFTMQSVSGVPAVTCYPAYMPELVITSGVGTGTYKIILCETFNP